MEHSVAEERKEITFSSLALRPFGKSCALRAHAVNLTGMETHPNPSSVIRTILPFRQGAPKRLVEDICTLTVGNTPPP